jgi:hypothetical protein
MYARIIRAVSHLELEEQILNGGVVLALVGVFLPWINGEWLGGDSVTYSGFGFYTSFLGLTIFFLHLFLLLITVVPLTGGPVLIRKRYREFVRLCVAAQSAISPVLSLEQSSKIRIS